MMEGDLAEGEAARLAAATWSGSVPAVFTLARDEVATMQPPPPVYLLLPRVSYLPTAAAEAVSVLRASTPTAGVGGAAGAGGAAGVDGVWFEYAGAPLRWHLPVGVLFDCYCAGAPGGDVPLPWQITVHYRNFPNDALLECADNRAVERAYMNTLKQAWFMCYGSTAEVMNLSKSVQEELFLGIRASNFEAYWKSRLCLRPKRPAAGERQVDGSGRKIGAVRHLPLRVLVSESSGGGGGGAAGGGGGGSGNALVVRTRFAQVPVAPDCAAERGERRVTLGEAVCAAAPPSAAGGAGAPPAGTLVVHGVEVPPDAAALDVWSSMSHPDGFLYVVVRR